MNAQARFDAEAWRADLERAREWLLAGEDGDGLYRRWFHRETQVYHSWPSSGEYRAVLLDPARYEPGWRVVRRAPQPVGGVVAMRGGRERIVAAPEMLPDACVSLDLRSGTRLRVHPLASAESGGFWHVWSAGWQREAPSRMHRVYLSLHSDRSLAFVAAHVAANPPRRTWAMKFLCGRHDAGRHDAALLYLPSREDVDADWVASLLRAAMPSCQDRLPPLVERIVPGVGSAPDPGGGRSFGQAVCDALASVRGDADDADRFVDAAMDAIRALPGMASIPTRLPAPDEVER
jgi:hypothetical protein